MSVDSIKESPVGSKIKLIIFIILVVIGLVFMTFFAQRGFGRF
jgi:hypothetical protein